MTRIIKCGGARKPASPKMRVQKIYPDAVCKRISGERRGTRFWITRGLRILGKAAGATEAWRRAAEKLGL